MTEPLLHAPGIYFDLDEATYHADPALGSSDIKKLIAEPADYWWHSGFNPARPQDDDTASLALGRAVHAAALFGLAEFRQRYGRCMHSGSTKAGKEERDKFVFLGKEPMKGDDYDRVLAAGTMIRANPTIADAFKGGASEVSIFWEEAVDDDIVRRKARFDYLRPTAIVDLKSIAPMRGMRFRKACLKAMKDNVYWLQATAYLQALPHARQFAKDGNVNGDADLAAKLFAYEEHVFSFVFWASTGAPLTWGHVISPSNGLVEIGNGLIQTALSNFVDYRREFGTDRAWIRPEPLTEISPEEVFEYWRDDTA